MCILLPPQYSRLLALYYTVLFIQSENFHAQIYSKNYNTLNCVKTINFTNEIKKHLVKAQSSPQNFQTKNKEWRH